MKKPIFATKKMLGLLLFVSICFLAGCKLDEPNNGDIKPEWTYDTGENPYGSKPWITGSKLIVCSLMEDTDNGTVHCVNLADGSGIWKMTDSTVVRSNPLVYNDLVIYGGYNVHALNLADGGQEWNYRDELVRISLFSSPVLDNGSVYLTSIFGFIKLNAENGNLYWKNAENIYQNLALSAPAFYEGKVYYASIDSKVYSFDADSGTIDWILTFESGMDNTPVVTNDRIYIGIHEPDASKNSLFCYKLDGSTLVWSAKIWMVTSDMAVDGDKLFAVGGSTAYCLSAATGVEYWKYEMEAGCVGRPVAKDGFVYFGNGDNLVCLDISTGKVEWKYRTSGGKGFGSMAISGDRLYASCGDGKIYCFKI
jgi:outer membrane protein assembly factor BamB